MNDEGLIRELQKEERQALAGEAEAVANLGPARVAELEKEVARLDGYLRGRADSDRKRGPGSNKDLAG